MFKFYGPSCESQQGIATVTQKHHLAHDAIVVDDLCCITSDMEMSSIFSHKLETLIWIGDYI